MNTHLKIKMVLVSFLLSLGFTGCEKDNLENEIANDVGLKTNLQASKNAVGAYELRINSGGEEVVYGSETFVADTHFIGSGKTHGNNSIVDIAETDRDNIYLSERSSQTTFGYAIPLENGTYTVKLHFAEIYWGATGGGQGIGNKRIFSVDMEGNTIISNYDINQEVGSMTADVKDYVVIMTDGELNLDFSASVDQPKISAIEIIGEATTEEPIAEVDLKVLARINAGGGAVTIGDITFSGDVDYTENNTPYFANDQVVIANTQVQAIYRSERNNNGADPVNFKIPVEKDANYTIKLHFAEIYYGVQGPANGLREFDVALEGELKLEKYNVLQKAGGPATAIVETFDIFVNDGEINIDLLPIPGGDQPKISAIEILSADGKIKLGPCVWRENDLTDATYNHIEGQTATVNGKLYLFGGFEPAPENIGITGTDLFFKNNTEIYDPSTDSWSEGAPMPVPVSHAGMQAVGYNIFLIGGFIGDNGGPVTDIVQIYNTLNDTWQTPQIFTLPSKSGGLSAVLVGTRIHIFGGYGEDRETNLDQHYFLDIRNPRAGWQERAPLLIARGHHGGAVVNGTIYAMGGQIGHNGSVNPDPNISNNTNSVEAYNFAEDKWVTKAPLLTMQDSKGNSHFELSTITHNGKIMIAGGNNNANEIHEYDPITDQWSKFCDLPNAMLTPTMMIFEDNLSEDKLIITCGGDGNNWNPTKKTRWIPIER